MRVPIVKPFLLRELCIIAHTPDKAYGAGYEARNDLAHMLRVRVG